MKQLLSLILLSTILFSNALPDEQSSNPQKYIEDIFNSSELNTKSSKSISKFWKSQKKSAHSEPLNNIVRSHIEAKLLFDKILEENPTPENLAGISIIALMQIIDTIYFDFQRNGKVPQIPEEDLWSIVSKSMQIMQMQQNIEQTKIAIENIKTSRVQKSDKKHFKKMERHLKKEVAKLETSLIKLEAYQYFKDSKFEKIIGFAKRHKLAIVAGAVFTAAATISAALTIITIKHKKKLGKHIEMQELSNKQRFLNQIISFDKKTLQKVETIVGDFPVEGKTVELEKRFKTPLLPPQDPRDQQMFDLLAEQARAKNMQLIVRPPDPRQDKPLCKSGKKNDSKKGTNEVKKKR